MNSTAQSFVKQSRAGLRAMLVLTVAFGLLYPALVWGVGQVVARDQAVGSLVRVHGTVVGSSIIGQQWNGDQWFHGRPSASGYTGDTSGGSNLSGSALAAEAMKRAQTAGLNPTAAPADALTASGSGLDPDVSPAYASSQVARVAKARGIDPARLRALVVAHTDGRQLGFLGQPRVNVLELNMALGALAASAAG